MALAGYVRWLKAHRSKTGTPYRQMNMKTKATDGQVDLLVTKDTPISTHHSGCIQPHATRQIDPRLLKLFPALNNGRLLMIDGHRMHFVDQGGGDLDQDRSDPILMVHGNPTWSFYWRQLIDHFSATHRMIAVDHIGCGLSDKPQHYNYCLDQHIDNLVRLIEELDLKNITLVVHDWGGAIGIGAAQKLVDRLKQIVITNTACFPPPYVPWRIRACRSPWLGTKMMRGMNVFSRAATRMATSRPGGLSEDASFGLLYPYDNWANRVAIDRFVHDIPNSNKDATWRTLEAIQQNMELFGDLPALIVWGMRDWCFRPECLVEFERLLPHAQVKKLPEVGHYVMEDAADQVIKEMEEMLS